MALEKQMELFEDGGLLQEGGTVDEASGNEVPVGSLKEEVRDDIPAQLSEGEFVMPADVVRYHGLDKMMALRDEAKAGLQRMDDMGQMGNAEEAIIPDDIPFGMEDLDLEDEEPMEMQVGGFVQPQFTQGSLQQSQFAGYQPQYTPYQMPTYPQTPVAGYQPAQQAVTPMAPTAVPQFGQFVTPTYVTYVNDAGNIIQIPVAPDGQPLIPVPAGFRKQTETPTTPEAVTPPTTTTQPITQPTGDDSMSPEEREKERQTFADISKRKDAAAKLGYTNQIGAFEYLAGALIPGVSLMNKYDAGDVMPDGTIADGYGNTFDPITGERKSVSGGLLGNIANDIAGAFGGGTKAEDAKISPEAKAMGLSPASMAGLMTIAGNQSINEAIGKPVLAGGMPPSKVETAKVETTLGQAAVTEEAKAKQPSTVTEAAAVSPVTQPETKSFDTLVKEKIAKLSAERPNVSPEKIRQAAIEDVQFDLNVAAQAKAGTLQENIRKAFTEPLDEESLRKEAAAKVQRAVAGQPKTKTEELRDMITAAAKSSNRRERENIQDKITQEMTGRTGYNKQYEADIRAGKYDNAFNARDRFNRDVLAEIQRSEQQEISKAKSEGRKATFKSRPAGLGEVGDGKGNVIRDSNGNPVKTQSTTSLKGRALAKEREQREAENSVDSRVICTELYRQGKLDKELYRMDVVYTARHLSPTVVKGYHYWAIPTVQKMRNSTALTNFMLYFTLKRAEEIAHIVNPTKYPKTSITGKIIKNVGEALCYGIGLFVNNSDYKVLYKGEKTC